MDPSILSQNRTKGDNPFKNSYFFRQNLGIKISYNILNWKVLSGSSCASKDGPGVGEMEILALFALKNFCIDIASLHSSKFKVKNAKITKAE